MKERINRFPKINHIQKINQIKYKAMLSSIFINRSLRYLYRLVKPSISEFKSIQELQYDKKQRQLSMIEEINNRTLNENKTFTKEKFISQILNTSSQVTEGILKRSLNFSAIAPKSLKHFTLEQSFADKKIDYPFLLEELENSLPDLNAVPMHFSYNRGVALIPEYEWDKKCAYVFNLPENVSSKEISEKLGLETIKQIKIEYCRLGLPAYAKVYFNSDEAVTNLVLNNKSSIEINNRVCFIKTHFDEEKLQLKNRRLVIEGLEKDESQLIFHLSQYGRVTHLDYPTFISRNPSLEQVRQKYKQSDALIKISHHRKDGSIDYEYYPSLEQTMRLNTLGRENDLNANIVQKRQKLEAMYKNRMRYAQEIDVFEGKENQVVLKNMGYSIVTFSTTEQAQNCYFNLRFSNSIKLFDNHFQEEFEIDSEYRKRILRFIDSEYQKAKNLKENSKTLYDKQVDAYFSELSMFDRLVELENYAKIIGEKATGMYEDQPETIISYFNTRVSEIKRDLQQKMNTKSFDQLAQKELFGRVLPKQEQNKLNINIEVMEEKRQELTRIVESDKLKQISTKQIKARENVYRKIKMRETRRMGMNAEPTAEEEFEAAEGEEAEAPAAQVEEEFTGKRAFSTIKKRTADFRQRNALETANYILRYCEYVRNIISEYQGVFPESRFAHTVTSTYLNPEGLTLSDGSSFLTEEDLSKSLQCMRSFEESQKLFTEFWKDYELFKSKSINLQQLRYNAQNNWVEGVQKYTDNGVVKEVYEVEDGEDVEKKVGWLNAIVAGFGEEFKVHQDENGSQVIIKVAKIENICPIDRVTRIAEAKRKFDSEHSSTARQQELFQKFKYQIIETGEIPEQIRQQFNIPAQKSLDDLFEQLAAQAGIYKKDIEMILNLENFTQEQIGEDIGLQLEMEKVRVAEREARASDFAKDPSNIEVRDKEGYFKVSKFRQI